MLYRTPDYIELQIGSEDVCGAWGGEMGWGGVYNRSGWR